jgi:toxin ParE1/3/4
MGDSHRIIISPEASSDLAAIHDFIARDSPRHASRFIDRLLGAIEGLKSAPHRTLVEHQSAKLKYPVRSLPVGPYLIYFRVQDDHRIVRILTIRHGARRRPGRFS